MEGAKEEIVEDEVRKIMGGTYRTGPRGWDWQI